MQKTLRQYDNVISKCKSLFEKKLHDYGSAWRILRLSSLTDQIFIKAQRIRGLQQNSVQMIDEGQTDEFIGIINYSIMALIQIEKGIAEAPDLSPSESIELYDLMMNKTRDLMMNKNHDYGEAWRDMRVSTYTDLILMKILRTKQIENKGGKTLISEGIDANFSDMLNYSIFALIRINNFYQ